MRLALHCGQLIDGTGRPPVPDATVLIEDAVIRAAGAGIEVPAGFRELSLPEATVLPGLIDCHVHLITTAGRTLAERLATPYSLAVAEGLKNAEKVLHAGFTTVRDLSGMPLGGKLALERGLFPGPRILIAVAALSQTAGHGDFTTPSGAAVTVPDPEHPATVVDGVDEVRRATRQLLRAGADVIKMYVSGGVMSDHDQPESVGFSPEELAVAVYEAHAAGKPIAAHAISAQGAKNAVAAGFDSIEHGMYLDDEVLADMRDRGTYLVPTLLAPEWIIRRAERRPGSVPEHMLAKARRVREAHAQSFRRAVDSGVRIAFGSDTGVVPHGAAGEELSLMARGGMSPLAALVAATRTAAELLGVSGQTGTLEEGKRADLLVVDDDPLSDIGLLADPARIRVVVKDGNVMKGALT
jgi:imidazolonepropionase-like amidohydrolase